MCFLTVFRWESNRCLPEIKYYIKIIKCEKYDNDTSLLMRGKLSKKMFFSI